MASRSTQNPRPYRIASVSFSGAWGGLEMSTIKYAKLFKESVFESFGICHSGSPIEKAFRENKISALSLTPNSYFSPRATMAIRRFLIENEIQHVFMHSLKDLWIVVPALLGLHQIKLVGFARMFIRGISKKDILHKALYSRLNKLIALSQVQADLLLECLPLKAEQLVVIPNGVDTDRFRPGPQSAEIRKTLGAASGDILFGLIGRLDRQKGSLEFVEAAATVAGQFPNARFAMIGCDTLGDDPFKQTVLEQINQLGLEDKITLTGHRTDIPELLKALDVFVMPSYEENFANVLLEALASGLPCISTQAGGTPEMLDGGQAGLLCEPKSKDSLANAMNILIQSPERRSALGQAARRRAESVYDINVVLAKVLKASDL